MMMNLFSLFDPSMYSFSGWVQSVIGCFFFPMSYWLVSSRYIYIFNALKKKISLDFLMILDLKKNCLWVLVVMFFYIYIINFSSLFPYIFSISSHLVYSMSLGLTMWLSLNMFNFWNFSYYSLAHLTPLGTPMYLVFFMVVIESISNLIRPLTLSIRLMANLTAGHLLLCLLGEKSFMIMSIPVLFSQVLMYIMEIMVSLIQAYVFIMLIALYSAE